jgi:hypothetical protein
LPDQFFIICELRDTWKVSFCCGITNVFALAEEIGGGGGIKLLIHVLVGDVMAGFQ